MIMTLHTRPFYSQTLPKRSSPPPKGFAGARFGGAAAADVVGAALGAVVAIGLALLQPPKSSSCVTVGLLELSLLPHPPKSSDMAVVGGAFMAGEVTEA